MIPQRYLQTVALLACLAVGACAGPTDSRPSVIVISVDTLNRSALRAYADDAQALPAFDRLARRSTVFTQATSPASWTLPSHASLFTGRYPNRHGVTRVQQALAPELLTLPELLLAQGYQTLAFTDGALLDPEFGHSRGFLQYDDHVTELPLRQPLPRGGARHPVSAAELFDRALAYLDQRRRGDPPFFMFLHTFAAHDYFLHYAGDVEPLPRDQRMVNPLNCLVGIETCNDRQWRHLRQRYDAGVRHVDQGLGQLLDRLRALGLEDSTLLVLVADHGEGFAPELGRIHHAGRVHADVIRIPFLLSLPGEAAGRDASPASLIDVTPTILHRLGLPLPDGMDGIVLGAGSPATADRPLYAMEYAYFWKEGRREYLPSPEPWSLAVIRDRRWYLRDRAGEVWYHMEEDPLQLRPRTDLAAVDDLRLLADQIETWETPSEATPLIDEELERHLRSLGYVD